MALRLERFTVGPVAENSYLLADTDTLEAVVIDPGDDAPVLLEALAGLTLRAIWLTHAHFDHVGAVAEVLARHSVPVLLHPADVPLLHHAATSAARFGLVIRQPEVETVDLQDGATLVLGGLTITCLHTPGHAPGHTAFYLPDEGVLIAGDALFKGSIGRTDLPYGDHAQLLASIKTKLLTLPPDTRVYPGHGPETTIGQEARSNPFLTS